MVTYREEEARLLAYTREPSQEGYPDGLACSVHFAYSRDGACYHALHQNYGILFAEAEISGNLTSLFCWKREGRSGKTYGKLPGNPDRNLFREGRIRSGAQFFLY